MNNSFSPSNFVPLIMAMAILFSCQDTHLQKNSSNSKSNSKILPLSSTQKNNELNSNIIIGPGYNRSHVYEFKKGKALATGQMMSVNSEQNRDITCTGTIVADGYIITAAHCLFDPITGQKHLKGIFYPGLDGNPSKAPGFKYLKAWVLKDFYKEIVQFSKDKIKNIDTKNQHYSKKMAENDLAIVKIATKSNGIDLIQNYGSMLVEGIPKEDITRRKKAYGINTRLNSYPSDKPKNTQWYEECDSRVWSDNPRLGTTDCDTATGSSGAAIQSFSMKIDKFVVMGISTSTDGEVNLIYIIGREEEEEINDIFKENTKYLKLFSEIQF